MCPIKCGVRHVMQAALLAHPQLPAHICRPLLPPMLSRHMPHLGPGGSGSGGGGGRCCACCNAASSAAAVPGFGGETTLGRLGGRGC
jgi:hypothetical protein